MNPTASGYIGLQIALHWTTAMLVLFRLIFGDSMTNYVDAAAQGRQLPQFEHTIGSAHYWVGLTILFLVIVRLTVRLVNGPHRLDGSRPGLMVYAARALHVLFYVLLVGVPVSGLLAFYVWDWMGDIHAWAKPVLIVLICVHGGAALFHHFVLKDGVLGRILVPARD